LLLVFAGGCDSIAPLQIEEQSYLLEVIGTGAGYVPVYWVYDVWEEGVGETSLFCITPTPPNATTVRTNSVPWEYSLQIEILRAGEIEKETISDPASLSVTANLTNYDTIAYPGSPVPAQDPIVVGDPPNTRTFLFSNGRRMSAANEQVMRATSNPLSTLDPDTYGLGDGLCSNAYPGPSLLDGGPPPKTIVLNKGDTVIVNARRADEPRLGVYYLPSGAAIRGELTLNGQRVNVIGDYTSDKDPGAGFSFSFTSL
jgi:hypothetical protein